MRLFYHFPARPVNPIRLIDVFPRAEISCYTEGHTDVLIPWEQLAPYLKSKALIDEYGTKGALEEMEEKAREEGRILKVGRLEFF